MKEIKSPQKNWMYFGIAAALVIMLLNIYLFPNLMQPRVQEVSYSAFLEMLERGEVGEVSQDEVQITFSDRAAEPNYYKTGVMDDPGADRPADPGRCRVYQAHRGAGLSTDQFPVELDHPHRILFADRPASQPPDGQSRGHERHAAGQEQCEDLH